MTVKATIKELLTTAHGISLMINIWTSPNKLAFLTINIYHISQDIDYYETLLHFIVLHGSHNRDSISKHIIETLKQYNIHNKLTTVTANNAAPNIRFLHLLSDQLHQKGIK
jgi:hypothetical protein